MACLLLRTIWLLHLRDNPAVELTILVAAVNTYIYYILYILYINIYNIYIYIYMVFTTEGLLEVAIESWPEWDLNPRYVSYI